MIPFFEPQIKYRYVWAVARQILSGWIGPGRAVDEFERMLSDRIGVKNVVTTTSGTTALMLSLWALDLPKGSRILFPAYGYHAGANAARMLGYQVVLCDVDVSTFSLRRPTAKRPWPKVDAVIAIEHNGNLLPWLADIDAPVIEDAAVCLGIPNAGTYGKLAVFSFSVPKLLTTWQGGCIATNDDALSERLRELTDQGRDWERSLYHHAIGGNFRMSDVQAAYGIAQMRILDSLIARRRQIHEWYGLFAGDRWCVTKSVNNADEFCKRLREKSIDAQVRYLPVHFHTPFEEPVGTYPNAEWLANHTAYLPSSLTLTKRQVDYIRRCMQDA